ncbi:uracil-DNA glycosylase [Tamilnaduibacter salinus]|uniref:IclR family transcriptional regulator n=1 Tax=Tamilnaduibacter salinus TaxID=1484056 RepID=A0A2A2I057_9GAMM|nr:uracil-DNA glycosylase family protein [Tamilnaduibacter salinus]PAV25089.1 IclR family transcriptional regulator [Tamilnaduibacter salinus]PVY69579.1 uracil-DNA glycosylase [Tamilnaduibacter salinus]
MKRLLNEIHQCRLCENHLEPRPVIQASPTARLLIIGQAPGRRVHETGLPFNDPSGDRLREWMGVDRDTFYDASRIAIMPMGLCYPGKGRSGDRPPRPECAPLWHPPVLEELRQVSCILLIGQYAQKAYLSDWPGSVTGAVENWRAHWPTRIPLVHPSPRNRLWLRRHPWFESEVVPALRAHVQSLLI